MSLLHEILTLVARTLTIFDGMVRTVVIAVETSQTTAVVFPLWLKTVATDDVVRRTDLGADAAAYTAVVLYMERFVGDELMLEDGTENMTVDPRPMAVVKADDALLPVEYLLADDLQALIRAADLLALFLFLVNIHKRQADIAFWHDERPGAVYVRDAELTKTLVGGNGRVEIVLYGQSDIIAGSDDGIAIGWGTLPLWPVDDEAPDKRADNHRHTPAMDGEDETETLVGLKVINTIARERLGDIDEALTGDGSKPCCSPAAVAGGREEGYHAYLASFMSPSM